MPAGAMKTRAAVERTDGTASVPHRIARTATMTTGTDGLGRGCRRPATHVPWPSALFPTLRRQLSEPVSVDPRRRKPRR